MLKAKIKGTVSEKQDVLSKDGQKTFYNMYLRQPFTRTDIRVGVTKELYDLHDVNDEFEQECKIYANKSFNGEAYLSTSAI